MREIILILLEGVILPLLVVCLIHTLINMRLLRRLWPIDSTGREQSEFLPVSTKDWEEKIHADLKGGDYDKKLVWKTTEGIKIADGIRVGYYRQDFSTLDFNDTVFASLASGMLLSGESVNEHKLRATAAHFLITGDMVMTKIGSLSEGQKGLVAFARLVLQKPGLLILDEPTNHINFRHLPVIARALDKYEGAMILVSHVPEFVKQVRVDEVLEMGR